MTQEIRLLDNLYTTRTLDGALVVLIHRGKYLWRVASARDTEWVLKGLQLSVVRV
jgi:hypothetical protein